MEYLKNTTINKWAFELVENEQSPYSHIYAPSLGGLKMLKTYIMTYLKTRFIWFFKSFAAVPIFFNKKSDGSFYLYVNYRGLNNIMIKN